VRRAVAEQAESIWDRFGDADHYIEPFFDNGAVLFGRGKPYPLETLNDAIGVVSNFWRAMCAEPDAVAAHADLPPSAGEERAEREAWVTSEREPLYPWLEGDPAFYDAKLAGWWAWSVAVGLAGNSGESGGLWQQASRRIAPVDSAQEQPCEEPGVARFLRELKRRFYDTRVCCGDWIRIVKSPSVTTTHGVCAVLLDPLRLTTLRPAEVTDESRPLLAGVRDWALKHADDPMFRIAFCVHADEVEMPESWDYDPWGESGQLRIWFSPHCVKRDVGIEEPGSHLMPEEG